MEKLKFNTTPHPDFTGTLDEWNTNLHPLVDFAANILMNDILLIPEKYLVRGTFDNLNIISNIVWNEDKTLGNVKLYRDYELIVDELQGDHLTIELVTRDGYSEYTKIDIIR